MRTLPAGLAAALKNSTPYVVLIGNADGGPDDATAQVLEYTLTGHSLSARIELGTDALISTSQCRLRRGAYIAGVPTYVDTSKLWIRSITQFETYVEVEASIFPQRYVTLAGDDTYENVLTAFATAIGFTAAFNNAAAPFWQYQFLPDGRVLTVNDSRHILGLLKQKYLIEAMDAGDQIVRFYCVPNTDAIAAQTPNDPRRVAFGIQPYQERRFLWRDEAGTVHQAGNAAHMVHNLGYLESTDDPPQTYLGTDATASDPEHLVVEPINLTIETGDRFEYVGLFNPILARTIEEYRRGDAHLPSTAGAGKNRPHWLTKIYSNEWFKTTEAGALPSTIEASAPYTPLNVSHFDGILDASDNNIQAAMDTIDDHGHSLIPAEVLAALITVDGAGSLLDADFLDAYDSSEFARLAAANEFTAAQFINGSADAIQLRVQGHSPQTANLQTWENSSGTPLVYIDPNGRIYIPTGTAAGIAVSGLSSVFQTFYGAVGSTVNLIYGRRVSGTALSTLQLKSGSSDDVLFLDSNAKATFFNNGATLGYPVGIASPSTGLPTFVIKATANQAADLQQLQNSSAVILASISSNGVGLFSPLTTTTNAVLEALQVRAVVSTASTGGAAGFGPAISLYAETATDGTYRQLAQIAAVLTDPTDATRKAKLRLSAYDTAQRIGLEIAATGSVPTITAYGQTLVDGGSDVVQLRVQGHSSQTADLLSLEDSAANVLASVSSNGVGTFAPRTTVAGSLVEALILQNIVSTGGTGGSDGIGTALSLHAETSTDGVMQQIALIAGVLTTAAAATAKAALRFYIYDAGGAYQAFELYANGSGPEIHLTAPTWWENDSTGLPYGNMYATNIAEVVSVAAANTAYEVTGGFTAGQLHLVTFPDDHYLLVTKAGRYLINWSLSMDTPSAGDNVEGGIMVNGTASSVGTAHSTVPVGGAGNAASNAILDLAANDQVSLFVRNHDNADDITVEHASLSIVQIGGT